MSLESLKQIFERDLNKLNEELEAYSNEKDLWILNGEINNTAGNLILHLCGNLQHYVGSILGNSAYIRKRDDEFELKGVSKKELGKLIEKTKLSVKESLDNLEESQLDDPFPVRVFGHEMTKDFFLIHLATHLNYHLGQVNYHRRLLANQ